MGVSTLTRARHRFDIHNAQGAIAPVANDGAFITVTSMFPAGGAERPSINVTWTSKTLVRADGSSLVIAASAWAATPPTPTLTQINSGGSITGTVQFFVRIAYVKNGWIVAVGAEANTTFVGVTNNSLKVTSPTAPSPNFFDGWIPLISTGASGSNIEAQSTAFNASAP